MVETNVRECRTSGFACGKVQRWTGRETVAELRTIRGRCDAEKEGVDDTEREKRGCRGSGGTDRWTRGKQTAAKTKCLTHQGETSNLLQQTAGRRHFITAKSVVLCALLPHLVSPSLSLALGPLVFTHRKALLLLRMTSIGAESLRPHRS